MKTKRGNVVLVLYPNSDLKTAKRRPALVVQRDELKTGLPQTILAMITSNMMRATHPSRVTVLISTVEGVKSGLRLDSVVMTDNLVTVFDTEIHSVLGNLNMDEVDKALRHTLKLET
jgi:mRNA interferase MazF